MQSDRRIGFAFLKRKARQKKFEFISGGLIYQTAACFCFFGKTWKEALREIFFFQKISLRDDQGCFSFCGKHIRDGFG